MAELELSSKRNALDTPIISHNNFIDKEIVLDYEDILEDKWTVFTKYLTIKDQINLLTINKKFGRYTLLKFINSLENEKNEFEDKVKEFKCDSSSNEKISFSKGSFKAIDLLNENLYNKIFECNYIPSDDIIHVYRIYFTLINNNQIKDIKEKTRFWERTCRYFIKEGNGKTGNLFNNFRNFSF